MKVIHLISGGDSGGAKTHVLSLLQHLNQTITAQLVCFRDGPFAEEARQMGIPTMICGGNNVFRTRRKLAAYIREGGYEIIHCHGSRANMIGAMLRKVTGLPVVTTVHSDYRLDYMGRPLSHLTFGTINALALRRLDYRIGVSDAMVDLLISRGFPADRFYTIYNGIDFTPPPTQGDRLEYLRNLGADVDENTTFAPSSIKSPLSISNVIFLTRTLLLAPNFIVPPRTSLIVLCIALSSKKFFAQPNNCSTSEPIVVVPTPVKLALTLIIDALLDQPK